MSEWFAWLHWGRDIERLQDEIEMLKDDLERRRVCLFVRIVEYRPGMSLQDTRPLPISLESLEERIAALETKETTE